MSNTTIITKEVALNILKSKKQIPSEGNYDLKVNSVIEKDGRTYVNLSAMSNYHLEVAREHFRNGDFQKAVNQGFVYSADTQNITYTPSKNDFVKVRIEEVETKNGITGLFITALSEIKSTNTKKVNISFFTEEEDNLNTVNDKSMLEEVENQF